MLWRVVQTCIAGHDLVGSAFPCLDVSPGPDRARGYAVVRAPFEATHIIVTPLVRTTGVEAPRLRDADAPNYFADAWAARRFVAEALPRRLPGEALGMAVNSRAGRSQDQLHIHVDCLKPDVRSALDRQLGRLRRGAWTAVTLGSRMPHYEATLVDEAEFARTNIVALAQAGLDVPSDAMENVTIAVAPVRTEKGQAFAVLARQRIAHSRDEAHGEALLDHTCAIAR